MKFPEAYPDRQTPEEDRRVQQPKRCETNNKDEGISLTISHAIYCSHEIK